ncbi:PBPRA1643 family SWIM/SEC-C metal-binding motif protein, partial [Vibrio fluvialis]
QPENTVELDTVLNKPKTITFDKTPNRNEPCICGSGKKYKKCCA